MNSSARPHGHAHGEAFMLMTYACDCGHRETIWNSRDGVTPFCMECQSCGRMECQHVDWQRDVYAPHHKLHRGQRFWRDGTPDEAEAIMRRRIASLSNEYPVHKEREAELIKHARGGEGEFRKGWPMLDREKDAIAAALVERIRTAALVEAAALIEAKHILYTADGPILKPRMEGNRDGLAFAEAIRALAMETAQ